MQEKAQNSSKKRLSQLKHLLTLVFGLLIFGLLVAPQVQAQSAKKLKAQEEEIRNYMIVISRQLGVSCTTCHTTDNFRTDEKAAYKAAKEHMKLTQLLIDNGMDGKRGPKADCYMCHRGQLKPDFIEKVHPMLQTKEKSEKKENSEITE